MTSDTSRAACPECARRGWLLGVLSVRLNFRSRDETRLLELLELEDDDLIDAIGGRRRREIRQAWKRFEPEGRAHDQRIEPAEHEQGRRFEPEAHGYGQRIETVCRHSPGYPRALRDQAGGPQMLHVRGGSGRLANLTAKPAVAIVGGTKPTDHGMEMARSLARSLSASGVTVVSTVAGGIAAATLAGAQEVGGPALAFVAGGLDAGVPASRRGVFEKLVGHGCAISELACGQPKSRWAVIAARRAVAGLAQLTIVVEAGEAPAETRTALIARELGRTVAAMPGRVSSPASTGTNLMLREGAPLVRDGADALELLSGLGVKARGGWEPRLDDSGSGGAERHRQDGGERRTGESGVDELEPRLRTVLERVGAGRDTPGKLTGPGEDAGEIMLALAELEVMGLLGRGDGGRYVPRESLAVT
jgi:DNA processing protein